MSNLEDTINCIKSKGLDVMNWKPGNRRIFKVLDAQGQEISGGMFSNELVAWFKGYLQGLKNKGKN